MLVTRSVLQGTCLLLATALLASCGGSSPTQHANTEAESLISSCATMRMTAEAWLSGAVPGAFASETLQKVEQSLRQEPRKITSQQMPPHARRTLLDATRAMDETVGAMRAAVEQRTPSALAPRLRQVARTEQALLALTRASGAS